jgi:hypothetical protein
MRKITDHIVERDSANHQLVIEVVDSPGAGGANHRYMISGLDGTSNPSLDPKPARYEAAEVLFQNGSIKEAGVNGLTHEALLAIIIDRLQSFQKGPFACSENQQALAGCQNALAAMKSRTKARIDRGVEGTHQK